MQSALCHVHAVIWPSGPASHPAPGSAPPHPTPSSPGLFWSSVLPTPFLLCLWLLNPQQFKLAMWWRERTKQNDIPCPSFPQAGCTSAWGFLGLAALLCLRGKKKSCHRHRGLKAEMGSHLGHNELLGISSSPYPWIEVSVPEDSEDMTNLSKGSNQAK